MADEPREDLETYCIRCGVLLESYEYDYCPDCSRDMDCDDDWLYDDEPE